MSLSRLKSTIACLCLLVVATGIAAAQEEYGPEIPESTSPGVDSLGGGVQQEMATAETTSGTFYEAGWGCSDCVSYSPVYEPAPRETWFTRLKSSLDRKNRKHRRESYFYNQKYGKKLMYPRTAPHRTANWGYYQTCWRKFPPLCSQCPPPIDDSYLEPAAPTPLPDGDRPAPAPGASQTVPPASPPTPELPDERQGASFNNGDVWKATRFDFDSRIFDSDSEGFEFVAD